MNLDRFGLPGIVGIGLVVFSLSFAFGTIIPAWQEFQRLQDEEARLAQQATRLPASRLSKVSDKTDPWPVIRAPELVLELSKLADEAKLPLDQVVYRLVETGKVGYYEVGFTARGSYPALHGFLRDALALSPAASLSELSMQRTNSMDPMVTASIGLVYQFAL